MHTQTPISRAVEGFEKRIGLSIKFDGRFYNRTGINQKRWGMLMAGKLKPNSDELRNISEVFQVPVVDLI
ncbi:hypothetical protein EXU85_03845 [Spirosoma sp. KCTC 42546]|uniref:hypothetical protein n=1 Tax=Spirosoma sp. KCTC 42546 TaxID=2520506 RepID=UPI00115ACA55|nr:hypothetical protein [Spirosoma sp. KCTC 42546]QDK77772.1 hypothetical protein EXU85_03845 [Spirosoma sp. KCTC 42546]